MFLFACFYLDTPSCSTITRLLSTKSRIQIKLPTHMNTSTRLGRELFGGRSLSEVSDAVQSGRSCHRHIEDSMQQREENRENRRSMHVTTCFSFSQLAGPLIEWETRREMKFLQETSTAEHCQRTRAGKPFAERTIKPINRK